jgi:superfamily II DNA or RNA helicase
MDDYALQLPRLWSQRLVVDQNTARQLLAVARYGVVETDDEVWSCRLEDGSVVPIRRPGQEQPSGTHLELIDASSALTPEMLDAKHLRWVNLDKPNSPDVVRDGLVDRFRLRVEDLEEGRSGLRVPQAGAVHAVLAYWSTRARDPATVVLPTGTGKTETMITLYASERLERLLVLVPTDNLRNQIAEKFETWGVLAENSVLDTPIPFPVVGTIAHGFSSNSNMRRFVDACNVVVATPNALPGDEKALRAITRRFSHLFIDEAHHGPAATWSRVRSSFREQPVVQFTATPYRVDGRRIGGRLIYSFPLGLAQELGYFQKINYISVVELANRDRAVAKVAVDQLRRDLEKGYDHLVMARADTIRRAEDVLLPLYEELGSEFEPQVLHSKLKAAQRASRLAALHEGDSRVMVCVDMFGEGFDFPKLKIAALHNPQRSVGAALQFIGRFARSSPRLGPATAVLARPDPGYDPELRALYAERMQWDEVLEVLSESAIDAVRDLDEFDAGFTAPGEDALTVATLRPKMSTVVYSTECNQWWPEALEELFAAEHIVAGPSINADQRVAWIVVERRSSVRWAELRSIENLDNHLHVLHWDKERKLLYINSSDLDSLHEDLAEAVCGTGVKRLRDEAPFRPLGEISRPIPTNIGVLSVRPGGRRFSMHVGPDVFEGFSVVEEQTKVSTNIFVTGFVGGDHATMGAARKGRIWSQRAAHSIYDWVQWAASLGPRLQDDTIDLGALFRSFVRPQPLKERPARMPLDIGWAWSAYVGMGESTQLIIGDAAADILDSDLALLENENSTEGPILYQVRAAGQTLDYEAVVRDEHLVHRALGAEAEVAPHHAENIPLSQYLNAEGCTIWFEEEVTVEGPNLLLEIVRDRTPLAGDQLVAVDWTGIDIGRESMGRDRDQGTVQAKCAARLMDLHAWDIVLDDDGTGEVADLVALKREDGELFIHLVHCKYSSNPVPGARVEDLYEVCGQAQRSTHHRQHVNEMLRNLVRRETNRQKKGRNGFLVGDSETLLDIRDWAQYRRSRLHVTIAQPGLSIEAAEERHLLLLSSVDVYVKEVAYGDFDVWCSA